MPLSATTAPNVRALSPMLLTEIPRPFTREGWTFELKYDGWRCLAEIRDGQVRLQSRRGFNLSGRWPAVVQTLSSIPGHHIFDGEMCVLDDLGRSDFDRLHLRASRKTYCVFDLLVRDGVDIMAKPLTERKRQLTQVLREQLPTVLSVGTLDTEGEWLYQQALALRLEGIVAKRLDSQYLPGVRTSDWLKIKRPGAVPPERFRNSRKG
jgi:bifunctional non-homologous end joining protein LigD